MGTNELQGINNKKKTKMSKPRTAKQINKKKKFVADGVFQAELNEFLSRSLAQDGYAGIEVRATPVKSEIRVHVTRLNKVVGKSGQRIRELTALVQKRFNYPEDTVELFASRVKDRGICAAAQAESLKFKLHDSVPVRMAANGVIRSVKRSGAKGCEVIISGKLRAARAKSQKFKDGFMIHTGNPRRQFIDEACRHVYLKQGVLGVRVKIMLPVDPTGATGPRNPLPDLVEVKEPKEDKE